MADDSQNNAAQIMMGLGDDFIFSISTAAYSQLTRSDEWRWAEQARITKHDAMQYTGRPNPTVTLSGKVSALFLDGAGIAQIDALRAVGNSFTPQMLVTGAGDVMGYWAITNLNSDTTAFLRAGAAKTQTFTLTLKYYGDTLE